MEHRPQLVDVQVAYEHRLRDRFGKDAVFSYHPSRGELREIKMWLRPWDTAGLPFVFMLHVRQGEPPRLRLLLWWEDYEHQAAALRNWARRVNPAINNCLDEQFQPSKNWSVWRRVFLEDDSDTVLLERGFDEETAREAADRVFGIVEMLKPHISKLTKTKSVRRKKKKTP